CSIAILLCLTTMIGDQSLYKLLTYLPGFSSLRAISRIGIVTMFPVAVIAAIGAQALLRSTPQLPAATMLTILSGVVLLEIYMMGLASFSISAAEARVDAIVKEAQQKASGKNQPVLFVVEASESPFSAHLDAMMAAKRLGWPTANGFSGNF